MQKPLRDRLLAAPTAALTMICVRQRCDHFEKWPTGCPLGTLVGSLPKAPKHPLTIVPECSLTSVEQQAAEAMSMKASRFSPISLAATLAAMLPALGFAQSSGTGPGGVTTSTGGSGGASSNPLLGGTGSYGSAAQGSTTGGGGYVVPTGPTAAIDETFRRLDLNGDGTLTIQEFRAGYATRPVGGGPGTGTGGQRPARGNTQSR